MYFQKDILLEVSISIGYSKNMSDYKLYMSNRLDSFIDQYSNIFSSGSLFKDKTFIVVQNRSIGEWLKLELASRCGVSANLNIILPENAVRSFIHLFPLGRKLLASATGEGEKAVLFMDNLKIIIYKKLEHILKTEEQEIDNSNYLYTSLEKYVKGLSSGENDYEAINSLRLYQLSDSIAGLFYYYGMNCQKLTSSWEKGKTFFPPNADNSLKTHEKWQMALWNELFKIDSPYVHLSSVLSAIVDHNNVYDGDPCRVVLFGSAFMGDSSLRFFKHLSQFVPVDHFILSPCGKTDGYKMDLLKNWATLFEGFNHLIHNENFSKPENHKYNFVANTEKTALAELQNGLINNEIFHYPIKVSENDESLKIVSTTGKWREVEALKNKILNLLDNDENLKLTDIGVLAPDINDYSHFISAVFPSSEIDNLPYNIIDLKGDEDSPFISAFLALLNLVGARFSRKDLFLLFSNRCFAEKNGISSLEYNVWLDLCSNLNIKWAVDEEQKKELHVKGGRFNSWESGFDRVLEGIAITEEDNPLSAPYELFNESSNVSAGKLIHIIRSLNLDINTLAGVKLQLEEWVLLWESIMETYLKPSENHSIDTKDRIRLKGCFRDILNMVNDLHNLDSLSSKLFDFFMFKSLISEFINKSGGSRGRYLTQGISCASLKPLRAVPFKVIMVLGLNEEVFPAMEDPLSFDLKESTFVKDIISIDLSRRSSDKYSFLEVFLSAREKVYLFYTGRNNIDNEILQPSPLINELSEFLDKYFINSNGGAYFESILEIEKLQPFDRDYFSEDSKLFSYNEKDFSLAEIYYNQEKLIGGKSEFEKIPMENEDSTIDLTLQDLNNFVSNPVKFFFNRTTGVYIGDKEILEEDVNENIELDFFEKRSFFKELILSQSLNENSLRTLSEKVGNFCMMENHRGELINSELSVPDIEKIKDTARSIITCLMSDPVLSSKPEPVIFTFGDKEDLEKGIIKSPEFITDKSVAIKFTGSLPPLYLYPDKTLVYVDILSREKPSIKHWLKPFLLNYLLPLNPPFKDGIKVYLVSSKEIHVVEFKKRDTSEFHKVLNSYLSNLENPVPLYPEIAELLNDKKNPQKVLNTEDFISQFYEKWFEKEEGDSFGFSEFNECPYRSKAYKGTPAFDKEQLIGLYENIYRELFLEIYGKDGA